ncbi:hypothetical protein [Rhizobium phage RHph_X2_30]|nr:hypothetical protein [Rhizobium phage RHph_X2_30]
MFSVNNNTIGNSLDIQSLIEQLKNLLGPGQDLVVMLTTETTEGTDYEVATTFLDSDQVVNTLATYVDLIAGDDEGVDENGETVDDESGANQFDHKLLRGRTLQ